MRKLITYYLFVIGLAYAITHIIRVLANRYFPDELFLQYTVFLPYLVSSLVVSHLLFVYLTNNSTIRSSNYLHTLNSVHFRSFVESTIHSYLAEKQAVDSSGLSADEKSDLIEVVKSQIGSDLIKQIEERYEQSKIEKGIELSIYEKCEDSCQRLSNEIDALSRRSNVNLIIGVSTTIVAVSILVYIARDIPSDLKDWSSLLPLFIPRFSIAIFIEIFSFFFLRLYKTGLNDIKYYQNELTTIESLFIALRLSMKNDYGNSPTMVLEKLSSNDRNRVHLGHTSDSDTKIVSSDIEGILSQVVNLVKASS